MKQITDDHIKFLNDLVGLFGMILIIFSITIIIILLGNNLMGIK